MSDLQSRLQAALGSAYRIEKELGGGGMSRVFVAVDTSLGRKVVVKVLPPEMAAGVNVERFRREIQLAASLQHPHIVPLHAAGQAGDLFYYTMPLVEGDSLRTKLAREGELPIPDAVRILRDVADALAHAHEHGVVHRDIKPDNVLISGHHAVVTDFGVAKAVSEATGRQSSLTSLGVALGTPAYMAPEQAAADPHVDHRADIYAVGVLGYEMLTGRPPFTGTSAQAVLAAQVTQPAEPVTQHRSSVPPALAALVMRCLEKKPADRWQSAAELHHQLEAMATPSGGMTPTGAVPAAPPAARRLPSRRLLSYVGIVVVLLGGGAGVFTLLRTRGGAAPTSGRPMLVVLPFENLGPADQQYFADGMTEEITTRLGGLSGLGVIGRTSANQYKNTTKSIGQIGQELGVSYALEGSVRWEKTAGDSSRVRISPRLIRVADGTELWSEPYEAVLAEVFKLQADIAERVAQALNVTLLAPQRQVLEAQPTSSAEAYDFYLRGRAYYKQATTGEDYQNAIDLYERAIRADHRFALAYAELAQVHLLVYWTFLDRSDARLGQGRAAVDSALKFGPDLPESHLALGYFYYWGQLDYDHALEQFAIAQRGRPNSADIYAAIANVRRRQSKWDESIAQRIRAVELSPRDYTEILEVGNTYLLLRNYPEAERYFSRASALAPDALDSYVYPAQLALLSHGDVGRVQQVLREAGARMGQARVTQAAARQRDYAWMVRFFDDSYLRALEQLTLSSGSGDTALYFLAKATLPTLRNHPQQVRALYDSARVVLEGRIRAQSQEGVFHDQLGRAYAGLGRKAEAIREGREAVRLLPVAKNSILGAELAYDLAEIYVMVGEQDAALEQLEYLLTIPSYASRAAYRVDPALAPLRGNPRFQRLVAGN